MRDAYRRRPEDFKRRILQTCSDKKEMFVKEQEWLNLVKLEELGKRYYNLSINLEHWSMNSDRRSIVQKISSSRKGKTSGENHHMFGKHHSEETKLKMSQAKKGKHTPWTTGPQSEEHIKKLSEAGKGKIPWNKGISIKKIK